MKPAASIRTSATRKLYQVLVIGDSLLSFLTEAPSSIQTLSLEKFVAYQQLVFVVSLRLPS